MVTVAFELSEFRKKARQVGVFADDQLPYAISRTLNDTMFQDTRRHIIGPTWQQAFTVRNRGLASASMRVEKSSKSKLQAGVFDALGKANLGVHASGGARPKPSAQLAIPNQGGKVKLHGRGRKPWARQVPGLVAPRALRVIKGKGIFVGQGGRLHAWYWFRGQAQLKKRFQFDRDFQRVSERGINQRFPGHIRQAVASSFR